MPELKPGDWVRIITTDPLHSVWRGATGIIVKSIGFQSGWIVEMTEGDVFQTWWLPDSLEYLGTEDTLAIQVLGDEYFA